jgi:signal peptidase II
VTPKARAWALAGGLCAAVAGADQAAKAAVEASLATGETVEVLGPLALTLSHNSGIAFGLAGSGGVPLVLFALVALGTIAYLFARDPTRPGMWVATGLLAGGAIGNLLDRIASDAVTDYIDIGPWPAFNLADVAITCGVLLLAVLYLREAERGASEDA